MTEPIDVTSSVSSAVALREEQPQQQPGAIQRFDARDRQTAIEAVLNRAAVVREVMDKVMKQDVHYGTIPGTNDKKVLLKAGAEKLSAVFRLTPTFTIYQTDYQNFHREYRVTCRLSDGTEGVGTCTTLEEKYRYRKGTRKCPQCGKETIIEGKAEFGGGWLCWAKKGGCGAKFDKADTTITSQKVDKVEHTNPADYWNTCLKMGKKRCLGSTTSVLVRLSDGAIRTNLSKAYDLFRVSRGKMEIPDPDGGWVKVVDMWRQERDCKVITIGDGTVIYATEDHRFPTSRGLKSVSDLSVGDIMERRQLRCTAKTRASNDIGWLIGFYLAEGHSSRKNCVRFTMHANETEFAIRITEFAESIGCYTRTTVKANTLRLYIGGAAFAGLMTQFVNGGNCYTKHLSMCSWRQSHEFLDGVLSGFLDGDGHKSTKKVQNKWLFGFTGRNTELAHDLRALCAILGKRCSIRKGTSTCSGKTFPTYEGWVSHDLPRYNGKCLEQIISITEKRKMIVYDLEVANESHLFCLANGIVSHNSHVDAIITATATSDLLTQDLEEITDLADEASGAAEKEREPAPAKKKEAKKPVKTTPDELPAAELKRTAEWLEAGKKTFVQKMTDDPIALPFAWLWAVQSGYILPTERLDDVPAERLFKSCNPNVTVEANKPFMRADYDEAMKAIMEVGQKGPLSFKDKAEFEAAYAEKPTEPAKNKAKADKPEKPVEVPRDPEAAWKALPIPAWSSHVKEKGFKTFGALPKNLLWWWCCSWQPKGYNGQPPAESDLKLRAILDTVKGQYDFENREDAGSEPASAASAKPEELEDDVPF